MHYKDGPTNQPGTPELGISRMKGQLILLAGVVLVIGILIIWIGALNGKPARAESYKDASGAAGLEATIDYNCKTSCERKFDFNIYIFNGDGGQVSVVRPDKEGKVHIALPEGDYSMLIGKQLGKEKLFPQEPLALKNGKTLELKLQYEEK
jgi:hypothetical protein